LKQLLRQKFEPKNRNFFFAFLQPFEKQAQQLGEQKQAEFDALSPSERGECWLKWGSPLAGYRSATGYMLFLKERFDRQKQKNYEDWQRHLRNPSFAEPIKMGSWDAFKAKVDEIWGKLNADEREVRTDFFREVIKNSLATANS
jgi:hypothetical protein